MANNSTLNDVLSMISDDETEAPKKQSTQQTLRDKMLNESRANTPNPAMQQKEAELSEEIISDEEEEELGTESRNKKTPIIIIALILVVVSAIVLIVTFTGKKKDETADTEVTDTEAVTEVPTEQEPVEQESIFKTIYDFDQIQNLLAAGATNDQVEMWQDNGVEYSYVYYTMLDRYYGWQLDNTLPTYDMASPEYKEVIDQTWMSLPIRTDIGEWTEDKYLAYSYEAKQNLDYEKIDPYGNQLFIKVYLDADTHDSWFFLNVTPQEWNMLDDIGNVVVEYTYQTHWLPYEHQIDAVEDKQNIFITNATLSIIESNKNIENKNGDTGSILEQ